MLFSRIISCLAFVSVAILAVAKPLGPQNAGELKRRDDPEKVVSDLKSKADDVIPHLKRAASKDDVSVDEIKPYFNELVAAFKECKDSLDQGDIHKLLKREAKEHIALELTFIIKAVIEVCDGFSDGLPGLGVLIHELDIAIWGVIQTLDTVIAGVGFLIGGLLHDIEGLLTGLGFALIHGLLGGL